MKRRWLLFSSGLLLIWCGTANGAEPAYVPLRSNPAVAQDEDIRALDSKLNAIIHEYDAVRKKAGLSPAIISYYAGYYDDMIKSPCEYLPAAAKFIQTDHGLDGNKEQILVTSMWSLPLSDYVTVWGPAVVAGYEKGYVHEDALAGMLVPIRPWRGDFALAYNESPVREFYAMVLQKKTIAEIRTPVDTVGGEVRRILSGEIAKALRFNLERGLGPIKEVDLVTTCERTRKTRQ